MVWFVVAIILIGFLWVCTSQPVWTKHDEFLAIRPSLTDEEFVSLCDPDVDPGVALKVREIIADIACIPKERIYPSDRFIEDLGLD